MTGSAGKREDALRGLEDGRRAQDSTIPAPLTARRLSQAISEGDGISVVVEIDGPEAARAADEAGAEALLVAGRAVRYVEAIREVTELPLVFAVRDGEELQVPDGVDACVVSLRERDRDRLDEIRGLASDTCELAILIANDDDLEFVLAELDPEILVLGASGDEDEGRVAGVLDLLPDVPAGKLAIADVDARTRDDVVSLERAGFDGVLVRVGSVAALVGAAPPEV